MIKLTQSAIKHIKNLQQEGNITEGGLRISVIGGGCSGLSYNLGFQQIPDPKDKVFEQDGIKVFVDPKSYLYIKGMELDYDGGLNGAGFLFKNPNAIKSCGCGISFAK